MQRCSTRTEQGGMNEVLANLYAVTGDPDHLALSRRFDQESLQRAAGRSGGTSSRGSTSTPSFPTSSARPGSTN